MHRTRMAVCTVVSAIVFSWVFGIFVVALLLFVFIAAVVFLGFLFAAHFCLLCKKHLLGKNKDPQTHDKQKYFQCFEHSCKFTE